MLDITLEQIENVLCQKGVKKGSDYVFQCPVCLDKGRDNLIFNPSKGILKCFSCGNNEGGQQVLDLINKSNNNKPITKYVSKPKLETKVSVNKWEINKHEYFEYMGLCNDYLLEHQELLDILYSKRGIKRQTVIDTWMGFDYTENHWVIPIFSLKYDTIVGFEYRLKDFVAYSNGSKVRREKGYVSTICPIYGRDCGEKVLYICEGFIDSYILLQWLKEKGQQDFAIYSCSNGVTSLLNCLGEINFSKFNEIKLMLDNDKAGDDATIKIIEQYPFIKDSRKYLKDSNIKDINDYYLKKVLQ